MLKYTQFRYCPHCGKAALEPFGENGFQCNQCSMKYFHNTASAVGGIIKTPEGILMTIRAHEPSRGMLDIPGGFTNYNETLETALIREIKEELGIDITSLYYMGSFPNTYTYANITYFTTDVIFTAQWECSSKIVLSDEIIRVEFVDPEKIQFEELAFESTKNAFRKYLTIRE